MFGRKKMYKKGLADAMHAYEDFGKKQEAALEHIREEARNGNKELGAALAALGDDLNGIYKYLNSKEKEALYHLSTPMDLKEMELEEKQLLLAILYQLAEDEETALTDNQRTYIRSVQKYLGITNPQTFADFSAIENIDSVDVQKTFMRVALEFFYLQDGDDLSDSQEEFFDYFSVNKKQATVIENEVSRLYNAVGPEGLAEKYGYVCDESDIVVDAPVDNPIPNVAEIAETTSIDISEFEEITIGSAVHIPAGTAQIYDHKIIHVQAPINCEGSLEFHSCIIHYGEIEWNVKIELAKSASLTMQQSTIENHSCAKESFIIADGFSEYDTLNYPSKAIELCDCEFINCWCFLETQKRPAKIDNCRILNAGACFIKARDVDSVVSLNCSEFTYEKKPDFYPEKASRLTFNSFNNAVLNVDVLKMTECRVVGLLHINNPNADLESVGFYSDIIHFCSGSRYDGELQITNSSLEGCVRLFDDYAKVSISQSLFLHCGNILAGDLFGISSVELRECRFDNCSKIGLELENSKILYCQFNTCFQQLFSTSKKGGLTFENCEFNNWQASNKTRPDDNEQSSGTLDMLHFKREDKNCASSSVVNCSFNGVIANDCFIISGYQLYKLKYGYVANVENCKFDHCTTRRESRKIIKEYLIPYFKFIKPNEAEIGIYLRNCSGLDFVNMSSGTVENFTPKTQISTGQPIGMTTKVENAGVLGYASSAV